MPWLAVGIFCIMCCGVFTCSASADKLEKPEKYWAFFRPKTDTTLESGYLCARAKARRGRHGFPAPCLADFPVSAEALAQVGRCADSLGQVSRWLNGVGFWGDAATAARVAALPEVRSVRPMASRAASRCSPLAGRRQAVATNVALDRLRRYQLRRMQSDSFRARGLDGRDVRIAVFDAGFRGARTAAPLRHLWDGGQILRSRDFVAHDSDVFLPSEHGTSVLSCIAGQAGEKLYGQAPGASFLLARTERLLWEIPVEEDLWIAALEWAERHGADLVNSSLGYTRPHHQRRELTGSATAISRAAGMAARRGLLVINSAGNEGNSDWHYIGLPADEDSVLTVGGTSPFTDLRASFSSFGPNAAGEPKPDVVAPGIAAVAGALGPQESQGTSFSAPLVTGFAACLLQYRPELSAMALHRLLRRSGHLAPYFDYALGHGVPQAGKAFARLAERAYAPAAPTFRSEIDGDFLAVTLDVERYQRRFSEGEPEHVYVFYHVVAPNGRLRAYRLLRNPKREIRIRVKSLSPDDLLRVHYEGYTFELPLNEVLQSSP